MRDKGRTNHLNFGRLGIPSIAFALLLFATLSAHLGRAAEIFWDSPNSGNWSTYSNWSNDFLPTANDNVTIDRPGDLLITLNTSANVRSLISYEAIRQTGGTLTLAESSSLFGAFEMDSTSSTIDGPGELTIHGQFNWSDGRMVGSGKTVLSTSSVTNINVNTQASLTRTLDNAGTIHFQDGSLSLSTSGILNNLAGATINVVGNGEISGVGDSTVNNAGTINVAMSSSEFRLGWKFNNTGTLNVQSRSVLAYYGKNSGVINISTDSSYYAEFRGRNFENAGLLNFTGGPEAAYFSFINAGTIHIQSGYAIFTGGNLGGQVQVDAGATFVASGKDPESSATATITGPGAVTLLQFSDANLPFRGSIQTSGNVLIEDTVNIATDQTIAGTLVIPATSTSPLTTTLTGTGNISVQGKLEWSSGILAGTGKLTLAAGSVSGFSGLPGRTLSRVLENAGTVNFTGGTNWITMSGGTFNNLATGTINIQNSAPLFFSSFAGTNSFSNAGTINISGPNASASLRIDAPVTNSGTINIGDRSFTAGASQNAFKQTGGRLLLAGGTFQSSTSTFEGGSIEGFGLVRSSVVSRANIIPTGELEISKLTLAANANTYFELAGTQRFVDYGSITGGNKQVGGLLLVNFAEGFESQITSSDTFTLMSSSLSAITGQFLNAPSGARLLTSDRIGSFNVYYGESSPFDPKNVVLTGFAPYIAGDFDLDGDVDGADFVTWQTHYPVSTGATLAGGDADGDGDTDGADFASWQSNFNSYSTATSPVPEPTPVTLIAAASLTTGLAHLRRLCANRT